ncbi:Uncharacterised protein [Candidatus Gugararchaeum adminiculabundum]|nr:Uncharacterised protein [Candidatus Gugararchaeum adminiculabundum]
MKKRKRKMNGSKIEIDINGDYEWDEENLQVVI